MEKLRVLVAEDHDVIRKFLEALLSKDFEVVASVGNGEQLVDAALLFSPDVIVSDIAMPLVDGLLAREQLIAHGVCVPFVFMTVVDTATLPATLTEDRVSYVHKLDIPNELHPAICAVAAGRSYFSKKLRGIAEDRDD